MRMLAAVIVINLCACDSGPPSPDTKRTEVGGTGMNDDFGTDNPKWEFALGHWERRKSDGGWVLAKTGSCEAYNVALLKDCRFTDVDVRVRFRAVSGEADASGGVVFRAQDARTYYVVRANALEDNFRLYKTVGGSRKQIAGTTVKIPAMGQWHTLRLVAQGEHIQAYLNEQLLIDYRDGEFKEGWVGLWTKEDSVTEFDDLVVTGK